MSARIFSTVTVLGFAALPFVACGGDDGNKVDSGVVVHDSGSNGSNGSGSNGSGSNTVCAVMPSYSITFDDTNSGEVNAGSDLMSQGFPQHNVFFGFLGSADTDPVIQVDIVGGAGATNSPDWPTTLGPKSGINVQTAKDIQVAIYVNGQQEPAYLAAGGTMNITAASNTTGQNFAGNITGLTMVHVDINGTDVTQDPDMCQTTFANLTWSGALQAPQFTGKQKYAPALFHRYH